MLSKASRARFLMEQVIQYKSQAEIAKANNAIHLTGNPPRGGAIIRQYAITPTGIDFFSKEAAEIGGAYDALPILDYSAAPLWEKLGKVCVEQAANLGKDYQIIRYDDFDPYNTADEMLADINKGVYKVTSLHSIHLVWNVDTNVAFRVAHDLLGHGTTQAQFTLAGEVLAYQGQCSVTPEELWPVLFTEIVGQVTSLSIHHLFGAQKVGIIMLSQEEVDEHVAKIASQSA